MGQKVNPNGMRLGIVKGFEAIWYVRKKDVPAVLHEDIMIRDYIENHYFDEEYKAILRKKYNKPEEKSLEIKKAKTLERDIKNSISRVTIERSKDSVKIWITTSKVGNMLGREQQRKNGVVNTLTEMIAKYRKVDKKLVKVFITILDIKIPELDAMIVAKIIASQLEERASFRKVQKKAIEKAMKAGAKGIKTRISGRLGGAEMARSEGYSEGTVPLHTLRADIDFAIAEAKATYGKLGVRVYICKGEILTAKKKIKETE
jgi:small subunit ribosomal protein S3